MPRKSGDSCARDGRQRNSTHIRALHFTQKSRLSHTGRRTGSSIMIALASSIEEEEAKVLLGRRSYGKLTGRWNMIACTHTTNR